MSIKAIVFDMDGTLIDTERYNVQYWMDAGRKMGFDLNLEDALHIRSLSPKVTEQYFLSRFGPSFDFVKVGDVRRALMKAHVDEFGIDAKPHVKEILEYLRSEGYKVALATGTGEPRMHQYMEMIGVDGLFDSMISTNMVENGKPAPDVYIHACKVLGVRPEECVAVEDAPNGIRSAYSAGCRVVFIQDLTPLDDDLKNMVSIEVKDLIELKEIPLTSY